MLGAERLHDDGAVVDPDQGDGGAGDEAEGGVGPVVGSEGAADHARADQHEGGEQGHLAADLGRNTFKFVIFVK